MEDRMSWGPPLYMQFGDRPSGLAFGRELGIETPSGSRYFAFEEIAAPWVAPPVCDGEGTVLVEGAREAGCWFMGRINDEWASADAAMVALQDAAVRREIADPPVTWAGVDE
jgi:hypothetical protein